MNTGCACIRKNLEIVSGIICRINASRASSVGIIVNNFSGDYVAVLGSIRSNGIFVSVFLHSLYLRLENAH